MKILKRIIAVAIVIIILLVISYCVFTANHIQSEAVYEATESVIH